MMVAVCHESHYIGSYQQAGASAFVCDAKVLVTELAHPRC